MSREAEIAALEARLAALKGGDVDRLEEIQNEISKLIGEGMTIADRIGTKFYLHDTPLAQTYGLGGLRYIPEDAAEKTYYNDRRVGWTSSASDDC